MSFSFFLFVLFRVPSTFFKYLSLTSQLSLYKKFLHTKERRKVQEEKSASVAVAVHAQRLGSCSLAKGAQSDSVQFIRFVVVALRAGARGGSRRTAFTFITIVYQGEHILAVSVEWSGNSKRYFMYNEFVFILYRTYDRDRRYLIVQPLPTWHEQTRIELRRRAASRW